MVFEGGGGLRLFKGLSLFFCQLFQGLRLFPALHLLVYQYLIINIFRFLILTENQAQLSQNLNTSLDDLDVTKFLQDHALNHRLAVYFPKKP